MTHDVRTITRRALGSGEARILSRVGHQGRFSLADVRGLLGRRRAKHARQFVGRLLTKGWIQRIKLGRFAVITDKEQTIVDALDLPRHAGGTGIVASALRAAWKQLDEARLRRYVVRIGNSAVAKRLGFLMETLGVGDAEALRKVARLAPGYSRLDPTLPPMGEHNRRWGLLVNAKIAR